MNKGRKKLSRRLEVAQAEHSALLDKVEKARRKLVKRTTRLGALEVEIAELEQRYYLPEAERLGQADAEKDAARPARLMLDFAVVPDAEHTRTLDELVRALRGHGVAAQAEIGSGRTLQDLARQAAERGDKLVIVAGDDATLETVARELVGCSTALAHIPLGSRRALAHALGIPLELEAAAALIGMGLTRSIDALAVKAQGKRQYLLESASVGLGNGQMNGSAGPLSGLQDLGKARRVEIEAADGETLDLGGGIFILSNAPLEGPVRPVPPAARMDDGLIDVLCFGDMDTPLVINYLKQSDAATLGRPDPAQHLQARRVRLELEPDGRILAPSERERVVDIKVAPGALNMVVGNGSALTLPMQAMPQDAHAAPPDKANGQKKPSIFSFFDRK